MTRLLRNLATLCAAAAAIGVASAQGTFPAPSRSISIVVPFPPGSGSDHVARAVAEKMAKVMNTSIVVENKPGATGQVAASFVARAQPDGYTLMLASSSTHSANPYLYRTLSYDPTTDFSPVGRITSSPLVLIVRSDAKFESAKDLVEFGRANPGKLSYGYGNTGGQVSGAMLVKMGGIQATAVSYKGTPQILTDIMGGHLDFGLFDYGAVRAQVETQKVKALAVTSRERTSVAPKIPPMRETTNLEDLQLVVWSGLMAPAKTPGPVIERLNAALRASLEDEQVKKALEMTGQAPEPTTIAGFHTFLREQEGIWKKRIAEAGITPQ